MTVPNILLLTLDDCGLDQINAYGLPGGLSTTPNIDALATAGKLYTWHYGHTNCAPGRSTVHLGRNPSRTGYGTVPQPPATAGGYVACAAQWEAPDTEVFLASRLKAAGYATSLVGKWHLHCPASSTDYDEVRTKAGFDDYRGWPWNLSPTANHASSETPQSYIYNAAVTGAYGHPRIVNNALNTGPSAAPGSLTNSGGSNYCGTYITTREIDDAISRVSGGSAMPQPWFLAVGLHAPHVPMQCPPSALYSPALTRLTYPAGHALAGTNVPDGEYFAVVNAATPGGAAVKPWNRAVMRATDTEIGRLIAALPNNTLIVFISDNGTGVTNSAIDTSNVEGSWDPAKAKNTMYDGALRLPLIVSQTTGTGIITSPGTTDSTSLIATADIYATLVEIAGGTMPSVANDSTSFVTTFSGGTHSRKETISQAYAPNCNPSQFPSNAFTQRWYAIRGISGYKVIRQVTSTPKVEFYQIADANGTATDQYETTNLLAGPLTRLQNHHFKLLNSQLDSYITEVEGLPTG